MFGRKNQKLVKSHVIFTKLFFRLTEELGMSEQVLLYFRSLFFSALFVALARLHFDHLYFFLPSLTESDNKVIYASSKNAEIQSSKRNFQKLVMVRLFQKLMMGYIRSSKLSFDQTVSHRKPIHICFSRRIIFIDFVVELKSYDKFSIRPQASPEFDFCQIIFSLVAKNMNVVN